MALKLRGTRKVQTKKTDYMSDEAFADLKEAIEDALAFERGQRRKLKVTRIQAPRPPKAMSPKDIARIREKLNCSQAVCDDAEHTGLLTLPRRIIREVSLLLKLLGLATV